MGTSDHEPECALDGHHLGSCQDENGTQLAGPAHRRVLRHDADCANPSAGRGHVCRPLARIETTAMEVNLPAEPRDYLRRTPQPTAPGPYHATVRGPGGLDVNVSGEGQMFGRILGAIGDTLSAFLTTEP